MPLYLGSNSHNYHINITQYNAETITVAARSEAWTVFAR
jgi:hypothetical protein